MAKSDRKKLRTSRHLRIRRKISGTAEIPRMSVYISGKHIYVQFIDDMAGHTLASMSTRDRAFCQDHNITPNCKGSEAVGKVAAERAISTGIKKVVFDRGGFKFHGRIKLIAAAARQAGLEF